MATKKTEAPIHPLLAKLSLTRRTDEDSIEGSAENLGDWVGTPFTKRRITSVDFEAYLKALDAGNVTEARAILIHAATAEPELSLPDAMRLLTGADFVPAMQIHNKEVAYNGLRGIEESRLAARAERESENAKAKAAAASAAGVFPRAD